ncbi:MAG TPA: TetR/AcrR family transcriptional regulator [Candidatus Egerieicola faecale]|uniref:TetR/AcrR family transcriptional regulator n=1 Tax=Candidatus Egerieicola faecale TaxID=2840774 RepID=A0A9D1IPF4_9FIRM|nr:TetR/AcrR family transcriptional regulator [Candidatus Egerieicola faecale]
MPRGSEELTNARKAEIINACAKLYDTKNFKEITLKEIGEKTSFTRTSIYNYFQTKEEIFLALLQQEYEKWIDDLNEMLHNNKTMSAEQFADSLARSLEKRERLLKLMSMNHYDMEANSRMENLVAFKTVYGNSMRTVTSCLQKFFPRMTAGDIQEFIYAFFPFLFGVYPYTVVTDKQKEAMEKANANYVFLSIYEITKSIVQKLLQGMEQ